MVEEFEVSAAAAALVLRLKIGNFANLLFAFLQRGLADRGESTTSSRAPTTDSGDKTATTTASIGLFRHWSHCGETGDQRIGN